MHRLLIILLISAATAAVAAPDVPALEMLVWKLPHDLEWQLADGPAWLSVGHTATVLTVMPQQRGNETAAIVLTAWKVVAFKNDGVTPATVEALATLEIAAADPRGPEPKRGLHRKPNGWWDFHFGRLPAAPFTFHDRIFLKRPPDFRYCLTVHAEGDVDESRTHFAKLAIFVMVAELLDCPDLTPTQSWPDGTEMPRGLEPSTSWYAARAVPAPWGLLTPLVPVWGRAAGVSAAPVFATPSEPPARSRDPQALPRVNAGDRGHPAAHAERAEPDDR